METIIYLIEGYTSEIILFLGILNILILFVVITTSMANKKKVDTYMEKIEDTANASLEREIAVLRENLEEGENKILEISDGLMEVENKLRTSIQKIGFIKYDAFDCTENRLSFSLALLDENNNGVILTSLYTNGESISYAKEVINKVARTKLSAEEMVALDRALGKGDSI